MLQSFRSEGCLKRVDRFRKKKIISENEYSERQAGK